MGIVAVPDQRLEVLSKISGSGGWVGWWMGGWASGWVGVWAVGGGLWAVGFGWGAVGGTGGLVVGMPFCSEQSCKGPLLQAT